MACNFPLPAAQIPTGKVMVYKRGVARTGFPDGTKFFEVPCSSCIGCRIDNARDWTIRNVHEAMMHKYSAFITLTYNPEHLPEDHSLQPDHLQKFMKRLRKYYTGKKLKFFACGEYGSQMNRPHYHVLLYGADFHEDRYVFSRKKDASYYRSTSLETLWPFGHSIIADVTPETARYTSQYVVKKMKGDNDFVAKHYSLVDPDTGEIHLLRPEFFRASNRPAIGESWVHKYRNDLLKGFVTLSGQKKPIPRFYMRVLEKHYPDMYEKVYQKRLEALPDEIKDWRDLERREKFLDISLKQRNRSFEDG